MTETHTPTPDLYAYYAVARCDDPATALQRATDLLFPGHGGLEGSFWTAQAERVLAVLLHAAALDEHATVHDVTVWAADPTAARDRVEQVLARSPHPSLVGDWQQFVTTNPRTRAAICSTILPALLDYQTGEYEAMGQVALDVLCSWPDMYDTIRAAVGRDQSGRDVWVDWTRVAALAVDRAYSSAERALLGVCAELAGAPVPPGNDGETFGTRFQALDGGCQTVVAHVLTRIAETTTAREAPTRVVFGR